MGKRDKPMNYQRNLKRLLLGCLLFLLVISLITIKIQRDTVDLLRDEVNTLVETNKQPQALKQVNETLEVCSTSTFKSYMDYRAITAKNSKQYELQQYATTNVIGLRMIDDYIMVAMTSQYGNVGDTLEIDFANTSIKVIIGDIKDAGHDDCQSTRDSSIIEFIVDANVLNEEVKRLGNLEPIFNGSIREIRVLHD